MDEAEIRHRAVEARRLLEEPLLKEALDGIEAAAIEDLLLLRRLDADADRERRALADRVNAIRDLRTRLREAIAQGKYMAQQPERRV